MSTPSVPEVDHTSSLWLIFLTGLSVGGLSCLAVQGGLLAAMIAQRDSRQMDEQGTIDTSGLRRSMPVVQFLVAKIAAYAALGALLGAFGSMIPISFQGWLMVIAGVFMLIVVLQMFDVHPFFRRFSFSPPKSVQRYIRRRSKGDGKATPFVLGALTVFIPCGVTLAMEALAIASNDPVRGALLMTAFTMGTAPLFLVFGVAATKMSTSFNRAFRPVAAVAIVAVAIMTMVSGARLLGYGAMFVRGEATTATIVDGPGVGSAAESSEANANSGVPGGAYSLASSESSAEAGAPPAAGVRSGNLSRGDDRRRHGPVLPVRRAGEGGAADAPEPQHEGDARLHTCIRDSVARYPDVSCRDRFSGRRAAARRTRPHPLHVQHGHVHGRHRGRQLMASIAKQRFVIEGMHCTSCSMTIDWELEDLPGVSEASTSYAKAVTEVQYDPSQTSMQDILTAIERAGFTASPAQATRKAIQRMTTATFNVPAITCEHCVATITARRAR